MRGAVATKKTLEGCEGSRSGLLYHACSSLQEDKTDTKNIPRGLHNIQKQR